MHLTLPLSPAATLPAGQHDVPAVGGMAGHPAAVGRHTAGLQPRHHRALGRQQHGALEPLQRECRGRLGFASASTGHLVDACHTRVLASLLQNAPRPLGWTSADAAGLPIWPGLVRASDVLDKGVIKHALRFTGPNSK